MEGHPAITLEEGDRKEAMPRPVAADAERQHEQEITDLYVEHAAFIWRVIHRLSGGGPGVEDLLQETFIVAWKKLGSLDSHDNLRAWLYAIASNLCRQHLRSLWRFNRLRSSLEKEAETRDSSGPDQELERQQTIRQIQALLARLPFGQREVFILYELEGFKCAEIADMLDVPGGTVGSRLHGARKKFKKMVRRARARGKKI